MDSKRWQEQRRHILKAGSGGGVLALAFAAGLITPEEVLAQQGWNKNAFDTKSLAETVKALGGAASTESKAVQINAPDIAENGMVVPIAVTSSLPKTESIAILIEKNPNMLSSVFDIPDNTEAFITTRVKMAQTSNVYALVKADGKYFHAVKDIKVTIGGCGG
jgi:sulfur-oxidizing protein SoxY